MVIFKVKSNIFKEKIGNIFQKLSSNYSLLFLDDTLFISPNKYDQEIDFKKALKPAKNFLISEINEENISFENTLVQDWCKEKFSRMDLQRFEKENQEYLANLISSIEEIGALLDNTKRGDE